MKYFDGFGEDFDTNRQYSTAEFEQYFAPEFRNRIDKIITFNYLPVEVVKKIVDKFINEMREYLTPKNVTVEITDSAVDYLVKNGYDKTMGARPLGRLIDEEIKTPASKEILFGRLKDGGKLIIKTVNDKLKINVEVDTPE